MALSIKFEVEPFRRNCLLHGLDDIGLTLEHEDKIAALRACPRHRRLIWRATSPVPEKSLIMRTAIKSVIALSFVSWAQAAIAEDVSVETVLTGLSRPSSVAVRPGGTPERYEVFVAESGSRRIIRMLSNEPNRASDAITDFPASSGGYGGPNDSLSGLLFLDEKHLVVSVTGTPPELRLYELTETGKSVSANQAKQQVTPELPAENPEAALGVYRGLARTRANDYVADMLFVAINGGGPVHGVWKVPVRANMLGTLTRLEAKPDSQVIQPSTLTISEQGYLLAIDASGRSGKDKLVFLNPINGRSVLSFRPGLSQISGMAYWPKSGNLYALATEHAKNEEGLFRFDDTRKPGEQRITVTKLADIKWPTALDFGPDGALYVTSIGDKTEDDSGELLKVVGKL